MKSSQNRTALLLMVASLLLLAASQWFWLKSEYKEHKRSFYSNSDLLFKETVRGLEDSLISKMVTRVFFTKTEKPRLETKKKKSSIHIIHGSGLKVLKTQHMDTVSKQSAKNLHRIVDSLTHSKPGDSILQNILLSSREHTLLDSLEKLKRIVAQLPRISIQSNINQNEEDAPRQWSRRRFNFLSASRDTVDAVFNSRIKYLGYNVRFKIQKDTIPFDTTLRRNIRSASEMHRKLRTSNDSIIVNKVQVLNPEMVSSFSVVPTVIFRAKPQELNRYLYAKLRNNVIFSSFLLLLTGVTFFIIYRNLQRQSRLNSLKNDLISNITHELKTPLSTLSVALEALTQFDAQSNPHTTKEYLEISQNEVVRLSQMVDNILKTSLLEKQGLRLSTSTVDLKLILQTLIKSWQPRFNQLKGSLLLESNNAADYTIEADETQITSIINNLLDNAIKYCKDSPQVSIHIQGEVNSVTMTVKDNGIGIPKEYQNQVFDKFFRVPTGDRHNVKGYGLGLNFVKHIMDLHRGLVTLESDTTGSTFKLTFKRSIG